MPMEREYSLLKPTIPCAFLSLRLALSYRPRNHIIINLRSRALTQISDHDLFISLISKKKWESLSHTDWHAGTHKPLSPCLRVSQEINRKEKKSSIQASEVQNPTITHNKNAPRRT